MIYKVHLRTACNCTREIFEYGDMPFYYKVPIRATKFEQRAFMPSPGTTLYDSRLFQLVGCKRISSRRTELWYKEVVER